MNHAARLAATVFGIGRAPMAPGTAASLVALPVAWLILRDGGIASLAAAAATVSLLGVWACDVHVRETGREDPSECVIDEVAGQWIACAFAPLSLAGFALAFFLFRLFDITKPWPISAAEKLRGGWGVMADDVAAGLLAGIIVAALAREGLV